LVTIFALPLAVLASGEQETQAVKVQGEVLDMACYIGHGAHGEDHAGCAKMCVKGGQPMGLLASDGTVYLLYAGHDDSSAYDKTKEFAGKKVEISGKAATKAGIKGIEVQSVAGI
jgi:hypothetical protein